MNFGGYMLDRLNKLKENMASLGLDGLVVTDRADVFLSLIHI